MTATTAGDAFTALSEALLKEPDVEPGTGFGTNPGLRSKRKTFAILIDGHLVIKLEVARCAQLAADCTAEPFEIGPRRMREWIRIADVDQAAWARLAREARAYVNR
jgi:hypothetical protein